MRRAFSEQRDRKPEIGADARKYLPGLDPLEKEANITDIQPLKKVEADRMMRLINRLLERGGLSAAEKKAFYFWKANLVVEDAKGVIHQEFMRDFWAWLLGRGKELDHKKSPWYRQNLCNDSEVAAYVDSFVRKRHEFQLKLQLLRMRHPKGINQHYLYFKYVIRGEEPDSDHFLDDWGLFLDEFSVAREQGQKERNRDIIEKVYQGEDAFHEMAPYGAVRTEMGKKGHDRKAEKMIDQVAVSWYNEDLSDEEGEEIALKIPQEKPKKVDDKPTDSRNLLRDADSKDAGKFDRPDVPPSTPPPPPSTPSSPPPPPSSSGPNDKGKEEMDEAAGPTKIEPRDENRSALSPRESKQFRELADLLRAQFEGNTQRILDEISMDRARREEQIAGEAKKRLDEKGKELAEKRKAQEIANLKDKILEEAIAENEEQSRLVSENLTKLINYQKAINENQIAELQKRDDRVALELANIKNVVNEMEGKIGRNVVGMEQRTQHQQAILQQSVTLLAEQMEIMQKEMLDMNVRLRNGSISVSSAAVDRVIVERLKEQTIQVQNAMREAVSNIKAPDFQELKEFIKSRETVLQAGLMKEMQAANGNLKVAVENYERELKNSQGMENRQIAEAISLAKAQMADAISSLKQGNLIDVSKLQTGILSAIGDKLNAVDMQRVITHFQNMEGKLNNYANAFVALEKSKVFDAPAALLAIQKSLDTMQQSISSQEAKVKESSGKVATQAAAIAKLENQIASQRVTIDELNRAGELERANFISAFNQRLVAERDEAQNRLKIYEEQNRENIKLFTASLKQFEKKIDQIDRDGVERARHDRQEFKMILQGMRMNEAAANVQAEATMDIENDNLPPLEEVKPAESEAAVPAPPTFVRIGNWLKENLDSIFGSEPVGSEIHKLGAEVAEVEKTEILLDAAEKKAVDADIDDLIALDQANQEISRLEILENQQRQQLAHDLQIASEQEEEAARLATEDAAAREKFAQRAIQLQQAAEKVGSLRSKARVKEGTFAGQATSEKRGATKLVEIKRAPGKSGGASTAPAKVAKSYAKAPSNPREALPRRRVKKVRDVPEPVAAPVREVVAEAPVEVPTEAPVENKKREREEESKEKVEKTQRLDAEDEYREYDEKAEALLDQSPENRQKQMEIRAIAEQYYSQIELDHVTKYLGDPNRNFEERKKFARDFLMDLQDRIDRRYAKDDEDTED